MRVRDAIEILREMRREEITDEFFDKNGRHIDRIEALEIAIEVMDEWWQSQVCL